MTPEKWQQIKSVLQTAVEVAPAARPSFLDEICLGDADLRREVEALLSFETGDGEEMLEQNALSAVLFEDGSDAPTRGLVGRQIGSYKIVGELGAGGMGAVYLAERADGEFRQQVAVKVIRGGISDSAHVLRRFRQERQILAGLEHPHIARLIDGGTTTDGVPYLVMEYVEGAPITDYAARRNLSLTERLDLFRRVCAAVAHAHQNLVIHRDLKPSNILVTADGTPKLLDFGIAKLLNEGGADETRTRQLALTPEYASPEQARGEKLTTSTDVYSLGVILYELLTGAKPYRFTGDNVGEAIRVVCETEPAMPSRAWRDAETQGRGEDTEKNRRASTNVAASPRLCVSASQLKGDLDNITLKALRKEPERRYSSVEQFSEDIRRYQTGLPVLARPDTFSYRAEKFFERNRAAVAAGILTVLALVGGLAATTYQANIARTERAKAERRFEDVRQLAKSLIHEFPQAVDKSALKAKELLVRRSLEYLDALSKEAADDRHLQRELAAAYLQIGNLQGRPNLENLGDTAGALESYRKSAAILEKLVAAEPDNRENRRDLSNVYESFGAAQSVTSDYAAALEFFRKSMWIREILVESEPANHEYRRLFADSLQRAGDASGSVMRLNGSDEDRLLRRLANYERALAIYEELFALNPQGNIENRAVAVAHQRIGSCLNRLGEQTGNPERFRAALTNHRRALDVWVAANPTDAEGRFPAGQHKHIGGTLLNLGDVAGALAKYDRAGAIFKRLAADDPNNVAYERELANLNLETAAALTKAGDLPAAVANYRQGLEIFERLAAADPTRVTDNYFVMTAAYKELGDLLEKQNNRREAVKNYQKAFEYGSRWLEIAPANNSLAAQQTALEAKIAQSVNLTKR